MTIWPVLLDHTPRDTPWSLGEPVSTRLRWLDHPDLPDDLILQRAVVQTRPLSWAHLVEAGDLRAVRDGVRPADGVTLRGCLGFDAFLGVIDELPVTVGVVRRVRVIEDLHERGIRRPGSTRLTDVPDAGSEPPTLHDGSAMQFLSPEQYAAKSPPTRWQRRGFLVDLEVSREPR